MNLYEHTIITRSDVSPNQIKQLLDKYTKIVEKFDGVCDDYIIQNYCNYVGITEKEFWNIANEWLNGNLFEIIEGKRPKRKFEVGKDYVC